MHPGIEGFGVAELSQRAQGVYGNLLGNVRGVLPTSHQGRCGAQGQAKRTAGQRLGRVAIARKKAPHLVGDEFSCFSWLSVHYCSSGGKTEKPCKAGKMFSTLEQCCEPLDASCDL